MKLLNDDPNWLRIEVQASHRGGPLPRSVVALLILGILGIAFALGLKLGMSWPKS